jgi:hypothetical protein
MYRRITLLPSLLIIFSITCSQFPNLLLDDIEASPTATSENTAIPQSLATPEPLISIVPDPVPTSPLPTPTKPLISDDEALGTEEKISVDQMLYRLQPGSPIAMGNIFHPDLGCNWMGVGGQVMGESGQPVGMLVIELGGTLDGNEIGALTLTGSASHWGPGGFEFKLADKPTLSSDSVWVQVLDLDGTPLSNKVFFKTSNECEQAAILLNFTHVTALVFEQIYLPVIQQEK